MIDWKPIGTLEYEKGRIMEYRTKIVLLWVSAHVGKFKPLYSGPVVGFLSKYGDEPHANVEGVGGYECENDFSIDNVTHWAPLPSGPNEEMSTGTPVFS